MNDETLKRIEDEARELYPFDSGNYPSYDAMQNAKREGYIAAATKYTEIIEEKDREIKQLQSRLSGSGGVWVKAEDKDFDSNIGEKYWRINGKPATAGMAFVLFKKKSGDIIELLSESPSPVQPEQEKLFSLQNMLDCWNHAHGFAQKESYKTKGFIHPHDEKTRFFKEKFNIKENEL